MWLLMRFLTGCACAGLLLAQRPPVEDAWDLLAKGERAQAVRVLRQIIQKNPRDAEARLMLGSILAEDGQRSESITHLEAAVRLLPRSAEAHNALGEALKGFGDTKAARAAFEKAVGFDPKFAPAQENLGLALLEAGESPAAAEHLDRAIQLLGRKPEAAYPKYLRAKIYTDQNETEKAARELKDAVTLRPDFAEAWSDLGQARKTLLDDAGALAAFERSVELDPENAVAQYRLGSEYLNQGKTRQAVRHLQASYRLNPGNQATLYRLQLALREDGQVEQAARIREELRRVLHGIDKESQDAFNALKLNNQGADLEKAGNLPAALEKYRAALKLDPTHVGIRVNFAVALLRMGEWKEGLAELREALRRDPANAKLKAALEDALTQAPVEFGGKGKPAAVPKL